MRIMGNLWSDCLETETNCSSSIKQTTTTTTTTSRTAIMEVPNTDADAPRSFDTLLEFYRQERLPFLDDANMTAPIEQSDYRGFCLLIHPNHGLMMLQCSKQKKGKPSPHFQLPGGHVDDWEFDQQKQLTKYPLQQLYGAAKCGCARELFEETGIDMRQSLDRFQPLWLGPHSKNLRNEHKHRLFFVVPVTDSDFMADNKGISDDPLSGPLENAKSGHHLKLRLSHEHTGFTFENQQETAIDLLKYHSGGKVSEALRMAFRAIK